jgi:hypothetical protein
MKRILYKTKKDAKFAIYACYMAANPRLSKPEALFAKELKITFLIFERSRVSSQFQRLVCFINHTKDDLLSSIMLKLIESKIVRNTIHFSLKMMTIAGWPSKLLYYRLDTLESLMPSIALYTLKISLPSIASSYHNQLFCLVAFIALK